MNEIWLYTILSVLAVSLVSLFGVFTISLNERVLKKVLFFLVSLSVGALFGDVFLHIIPELFAESEITNSSQTIAVYIFFGFIAFFILEKILKWHHSHVLAEEECDECESDISEQNQASKHIGHLNLTSDALHNFIDGILIASGYMIGFEVGVATTIAVFLHEVPQEIGDFGILVHTGFSRRKALFYNFLSGLIAIFGALLTLAVGSFVVDISSVLLAVTAGSFIYIAAADLVPELHKTKSLTKSLLQLFGIICGFVIMLLLLFIE